jgi:hypothetical protein
MQMQHYDMAVSAIAAKSKNDALAALEVLQADAFRWQTNPLTIAGRVTISRKLQML